MDSRSRFSHAKTLALLALVVCASTTVLSFWMPYRAYGFSLALVFSLLLLVALPIFWKASRSRARLDIFEPINIFSSVYMLLFGIRALDTILLSKDYFTEDTYLNEALLYSILGLAFFYVGYYSRFGRAMASELPVLGRNWRRNRVWHITFFYSLIGLLSYFVLIRLAGGVVYQITHLSVGTTQFLRGKFYLVWGVLFAKVAFLVYYSYCLERKRIGLKLWGCFAALLFLLGSLGERGHVVFSLLEVTVLYHYLVKRISLRKVLLALPFIVCFVVAYGIYRDFITRQSYDALWQPGFWKTLYSYFLMHFDQLGYFSKVLKGVPGRLDYQYGFTYFAILLRPIPRAYFPNKPPGAGEIITKSLFPLAYEDGVTVAPSILAESYVNFHIAGILVGMLLFGIACRTLYCYLRFNPGNKAIALIYALSLSTIIGEIRGDFATVTSFYLMLVVPTLIAIGYGSSRKRAKKLARVSKPPD